MLCDSGVCDLKVQSLLVFVVQDIEDFGGFILLVKLIDRFDDIFVLLQWNECMDREDRDAYYLNWPIYFP